MVNLGNFPAKGRGIALTSIEAVTFKPVLWME